MNTAWQPENSPELKRKGAETAKAAKTKSPIANKTLNRRDAMGAEGKKGVKTKTWGQKSKAKNGVKGGGFAVVFIIF
jgi:hypothetical protein